MKALEERYNNVTDTELIQKILNKDVALFELLIRRNNSYLYRLGRSYGYNHHDVEDLMQETYISAYQNLSKFENRSSFKTWLIKIMMNYCNGRLRNAGFRNEKVNGETDKEENVPYYAAHTNTDVMVLNKELAGIIESAIEKIPIEYRVVFTLRELNGLSVNETAETVNISEANVKVRLNRAKRMLRKEIEKMYAPAEIYEFNLVYCDKIVDQVMHHIGVMNA